MITAVATAITLAIGAGVVGIILMLGELFAGRAW